MGEVIIRADDVRMFKGSRQADKSFSFAIEEGQQWAVTGTSGSGKTTLLKTLAGQQHASGEIFIAPSLKIVFVPQQHHFLNRSHTDAFYYQQRYHSFDASDAQAVQEAFPSLYADDEAALHLQHLFGIQALKHQSLLHLSNGENKRLQLAKALLQQPDVLLLDAPFTGLDAASRKTLEDCMVALNAGGTTIILTCTAQRVPHFITHVLQLSDDGSAEVYKAHLFKQPIAAEGARTTNEALVKQLLQQQATHDFAFAVRLENVNIRYGSKTVLQGISWTVKKGERWSLSGPNGAGKSTLLSLITADNPQAYANEIYLFDRRRGSGESIWDIKKAIGYVSPELQLYFGKTISVFDAVASGFFDTIGLFRQLSEKQANLVLKWLSVLHLQDQKNKLLSQLPLGQQRLVLLARALIKCPPLLVLDEPLQGLDETQAAFFTHVIELVCRHTNQTLIYVSHYTDELPHCITHYLRLEGGKAV